MNIKEFVPEKLFGAEIFANRLVIPCGEVDFAEKINDTLFEIKNEGRPETIPETKNGYHFVCGVRVGDVETIYYVTDVEQAQSFWDYYVSEKCDEIRWYILHKEEEEK